MRITALSERGLVDRSLSDRLKDFDEATRKISQGKDVALPSDDPLRYVRARAFRHEIRRIEQFSRNADDATRLLDASEDAGRDLVDIVQRLRTLAVRSGSDNLITADRRLIAVEANELLEELVRVGNTRTEDGAIFAGADTEADAFEAERDASGDITRVVYRGDDATRSREIDPGLKVSVNVLGSQLFRATAHDLTGTYSTTTPATPLAAAIPPVGGATTGAIVLNGKTVSYDLSTDSLNGLATKINQASAGMTASVATSAGNSSLRLVSDKINALAIADGPGGNLAQNLGLIDGAGPVYANIPANPNGNKDRTLFDIGIEIRDAMKNGDGLSLRNGLLDDLDNALENVLGVTSAVAGRRNQVSATKSRHDDARVEAERIVSESTDLDFSKAITDLQRARTSLEAAARAGESLPRPGILRFL